MGFLFVWFCSWAEMMLCLSLSERVETVCLLESTGAKGLLGVLLVFEVLDTWGAVGEGTLLLESALAMLAFAGFDEALVELFPLF